MVVYPSTIQRGRGDQRQRSKWGKALPQSGKRVPGWNAFASCANGGYRLPFPWSLRQPPARLLAITA